MTEKLSGVIIVGVIVGYLLNPQLIAGTIYSVGEAVLTYWAD